MKQVVIFGWLLAAQAVIMLLILTEYSLAEPVLADEVIQPTTTELTLLPNVKPVEHAPDRIRVPKLGVNLAVQPAEVRGNDWTIHESAASWLENSGGLVDGNMVIYAHNQRQVFGGIKALEVGDEIEVESGSTRAVYRIEYHFEGKATDVQHINATENRLTLYTCSGPLDLNRYFVMAKIVSIESV